MYSSKEIDVCNVMTRTFKYFMMGVSVAVIANSLSNSKVDTNNILILAVSSSLVYSVLDGPIFTKENYYNTCL